MEVTYLSSSEMTLIFSQPSGGSRTNEYDLLGRGLATTLKVSGDSHLSISECEKITYISMRWIYIEVDLQTI